MQRKSWGGEVERGKFRVNNGNPHGAPRTLLKRCRLGRRKPVPGTIERSTPLQRPPPFTVTPVTVTPDRDSDRRGHGHGTQQDRDSRSPFGATGNSS